MPRAGELRIELYRSLVMEPYPFTALFFCADFYAAEAVIVDSRI